MSSELTTTRKQINKLTVPGVKGRVRSELSALSLKNVDVLAAKYGHRVLFTPPRHSDLQPIELVWAAVKTPVGRGYREGMTFADCKVALKKQFDELAADQGQHRDDGDTQVGAIIRHTDEIAEGMLRDELAALGSTWEGWAGFNDDPFELPDEDEVDKLLEQDDEEQQLAEEPEEDSSGDEDA